MHIFLQQAAAPGALADLSTHPAVGDTAAFADATAAP